MWSFQGIVPNTFLIKIAYGKHGIILSNDGSDFLSKKCVFCRMGLKQVSIFGENVRGHPIINFS